MGRILVLGGTAWLGREIARSALLRGDEVTCLARGESGGAADGVRFVAADRDRPNAYEAVAQERWDEIVDVSWQPGQVASAVSALADRTAHWTYISSVSVYDGDPAPGDDETAPLQGEWHGQTATLAEYGPAKVRCEQLVSDHLGDRALLVRAGLLVGPGDPTDRFGYWVSRLALAGGEDVLAPDVPSMPVQVLDARDLAAWVATAAGRGIVGPVDAVGPVRQFHDVMTSAAEAAGFRGTIASASSAWLVEQGVSWWSGPRSLPLWLPMPESAGAMSRSGARARSFGLTTRSLAQTLRDTLADERERGLERPRRAGLERSEELALISGLS